MDCCHLESQLLISPLIVMWEPPRSPFLVLKREFERTMIATAAWDERAPDIKGRSSMEPNKQRYYELTWTPVGAALPLTTNCAGTFCAQATPPSAMAAAASNPQRAMR
jgi:hypothetical protein